MKRLKQTFPLKVKTEGSALLISIVLSGLMITVGVMSARLAVKELSLSTDLFMSEKAYISAESGIEKALWQLKDSDNAINHVAPTLTPGDIIPELEDDHTEVSIRNLINTPDSFTKNDFTVSLAPLESTKFRFKKDTSNDVTNTVIEIDNTQSVAVEVNPNGDYFWRFICSDGANTIALQAKNVSLPSGNISNLMSEEGVLDDGSLERFNTWTGINKDSCFISLQNLSGAPQSYTFSGATMAPDAAHIYAIGNHLGREKHIRFDYAQKNLGSIFDFSFLHSEDGL